jgi:CubicO group peptidase (beta-lactamase class C family)
MRVKSLICNFLTLTCILLVTTPVAADNGHAYGLVKQQLRAYFQQLEESTGFNGSVLVGRDGKVLLQAGYGMADFEEEIANQADTVHAIASVTKSFTAASIMMLQERGLLDIDDTVDMYLPGFPYGDQLTLRHLLNQTSGLFEMTENPAIWPRFGEFHTPEELLDYFVNEPLSFPPGTQFEYSNSNFVTLGLIIEHVSGLSYRDFLAQNILEPLRMSLTSYDPYDQDFPDRAVGYTTIDPPVVSWYLHPSVPYAAGAVFSSVVDLYSYDQALNNVELLTTASLEEMYTPAYGNYGFGWYIDEIEVGGEARRHVWHWGAYVGYHGYLSRLVDDNVTVILLLNHDAVLVTPDELRPIVEDAVAIVFSQD